MFASLRSNRFIPSLYETSLSADNLLSARTRPDTELDLLPPHVRDIYCGIISILLSNAPEYRK